MLQRQAGEERKARLLLLNLHCSFVGKGRRYWAIPRWSFDRLGFCAK